MIKVVVNNYVKEECVEEYLSLIKEAVAETNAKDKGCIRYELNRSIQNPLHFIMLEEWESQELLDAHMQSEHFKRIIPKLAPCCQNAGDITLLTKAF